MAESGQCPACAEPFTAAEVAGFGILRARSAQAGGPIMEYPCQACGRRMRLIPHGDGRYAPPGQPPPPPVSEQERRPPWASKRRPRKKAAAEPVPPPVTEIPTPPSASQGNGPEPADPAQRAGPPPDLDNLDDGVPLSVAEALELLGVGPEAAPKDLERAFRERSKTCHPDKVAHLDPDFQRLAEHKFKRLRAALELLRA